MAKATPSSTACVIGAGSVHRHADERAARSRVVVRAALAHEIGQIIDKIAAERFLRNRLLLAAVVLRFAEFRPSTTCCRRQPKEYIP
jgi:hypothetical protein